MSKLSDTEQDAADAFDAAGDYVVDAAFANVNIANAKVTAAADAFDAAVAAADAAKADYNNVKLARTK
ncbi:MAG: hypothetical protein GY820_10365 [Gammaproteobacteria bacterium]|nr:hypothetical protein [Gammaproteobacteria bacterium]